MNTSNPPIDLLPPPTAAARSSLPHLALVLVAAYVGWTVLWSAIRRWALHKTTCLGDLELLGKERKGGKIEGTVVVAGGSLAGLFTARMLSFHFTHILLLEPDTSIGSSRRSRVGQSLMLHGFHGLVLSVASALFQGFERDVKEKGGRVHKAGILHWVFGAKEIKWESEDGPRVLSMTRMGLENLVRSRTMKDTPGLSFLPGLVTSLHSSMDGTRITKVSYRPNGSFPISEINCDLFVDATGTACAGRKWLVKPSVPDGATNPGWSTVKQQLYRPNVRYSTGIIRCPSIEFLKALPSSPRIKDGWVEGGWQYLHLPSLAVDQRAALVFSGDDNKICLGSVARGKGQDLTLPRTIPQYLEYLQDVSQLSTGHSAPTWLSDSLHLIDQASHDDPTSGPTVEFHTWQEADSYANEYHDATRLPTNFVAVGDAVMHVNPAFGQGCAKLASNCVTLNAILHSTTISKSPTAGGGLVFPPSFGREFFKLDWSRTYGLYEVNKALDSASEACEFVEKGQRKEDLKGMRYFLDGVVRGSLMHRDMANQFAQVMLLNAPAVDLFHPVTLVRALWSRAVYGPP